MEARTLTGTTTMGTATGETGLLETGTFEPATLESAAAGATATDAAPPRRVRRPPLDPRLVRHVRAARGHIALQGVLGLIQAVSIIAIAILLGMLGEGLLAHRVLPWDRPELLFGLLAALGARAAIVLLQQRTAHRAATAAISDLRGRLVRHGALLGPRGAAGRGADLTALASTGIEALRPYLAGYVPQLLLAATVTPLCLGTIALLDMPSALLAAVSIPLIPIFMILVGQLTEGRSERLLIDMRALWAQVLDLVEGLPTLRALGRERGPEATVHALGERHRESTMGSLRFAFLSSMVLELLATLGVALVAVGIGMRLVHGDMELAPAIAVLVLAPELYLPLRQVGQQFHASTDGLAAVDATFAELEQPVVADGTARCPDLRSSSFVLEGVSVRSRDGFAPENASLRTAPGRILAITGASGAGKTTAVQCLLGLVAPDAGRALVVTEDGASDVRVLRRESLWSQIAYLPQRPVVGPGRLRELLADARPGAADAILDEAARATGLDRVAAERGWDALVGRGGEGLSLGQRQRLALARAVLSPAPVVILDEPTAHLDGASERTVLDLLTRFRAEGRSVIVVAHRSALVDIADDVVALGAVVVPSADRRTDEEARV